MRTQFLIPGNHSSSNIAKPRFLSMVLKRTSQYLGSISVHATSLQLRLVNFHLTMVQLASVWEYTPFVNQLMTVARMIPVHALKYYGFYKRLFNSEDHGSNKEGPTGESRVPVKTIRQRKTKLVIYVLG